MTTLDKVHDKSVKFGSFVNYDARYIAEIAAFINSEEVLQSCYQKKPMNIIAMAGTWDLYFWTPRNFIRNPLNGKALLRALHRLMSLGCDEYIRITWVTTVPQVHRFINWSNNFSLMASMQWLLNHLYHMNYKNLEIVDIFRLILPTMTGNRDDNVCKNHYLCHKGFQDQMLQTVAGKVALSTIMHAACNMKDESSSSTYYNATTTTITWNHQQIRDLSLFPSGTLVQQIDSASNISYDVYMIWNGMRRLVPDIETIECMKFNIADVFRVSELELLNVAIDMPFPTLKDKSLSVSIDRKYYVIDKCKRRLISDADLYLLTIEFIEEDYKSPSNQDIPFIDQYDLKLIPSGIEVKRYFGNELIKKLENKVVRLHTEGALYLIQNSTKCTIPNMEAIESFAINITNIYILTKDQFLSIRNGNPLLVNKIIPIKNKKIISLDSYNNGRKKKKTQSKSIHQPLKKNNNNKNKINNNNNT